MVTLCIVALSGEPSPQLREALERDGVRHLTVRGREELAGMGFGQSPDAVVLDASTPSLDQATQVAETCRGLRLPLLLALTAETLEVHDFASVGDDFILYPIRPGELIARVRRLLHSNSAQRGEEVVQAGDLTIDLQRYEVSVAGRKVLLTFKEYQLLKLLVSNPGRVYRREELLDQVWGYDYYGGTRSVDVHIRRLRSKIEDAHHSFIETVWNVGYRFKE